LVTSKIPGTGVRLHFTARVAGDRRLDRVEALVCGRLGAKGKAGAERQGHGAYGAAQIRGGRSGSGDVFLSVDNSRTRWPVSCARCVLAH
jgi:hypothetical protein